MHKLLLIEDTEEGQILVKRALVNMNIELVTADKIESGLNHLKHAGDAQFDLVMLDLSLPDGDGFEILEYLNLDPRTREIDVILLTSNGKLSAKVAAFNLGAEDYLVKPIDPIELRARVEMRLRKKVTRRKTEKDFRRGPVRFEPALMKVWVKSGEHEELTELTNKEFKILYCLAKNHTEVFSRVSLVKSVWGQGVHVLERTVDSHICSIRKKIQESIIESIPGAGYRFGAAADVRVTPSEN